MNPQTRIARQLRKKMTPSERRLWYHLQRSNLGISFRRQEPIGSYIVDFVCYSRRLIIEIDGGQHANNENDKIRDVWLESQGFRILRFWNNEVVDNLDGVLYRIQEQLHPSLTLPIKGRE